MGNAFKGFWMANRVAFGAGLPACAERAVM
ncbi:MAG: hypothetical protein QOF30_1125 [Acidimicrobiaceae bacterium]|jgi:hypothetical protein|nr:hypothetical protein [Acidimicrobiaceae bacterium]